MKVIKFILIIVAIGLAVAAIAAMSYYMALNYGVKAEDLSLSDETIVFLNLIL